MRSQSEILHFRKMQATGNDYIYFGPYTTENSAALDGARTEQILEWLNEYRIRQLSDRHFGIGGDGVVLIAPPHGSDALARMYMWNADGSPSAMCGNALRSVALLLHRWSGEREFLVETGEKNQYRCRVEATTDSGESAHVSVDMGLPILDPDQVPFAPVKARIIQPPDYHKLIPALVEVEDSTGKVWKGRILSMGNPHFVISLQENGIEPLESLDLQDLGPRLERHPAFPERVNIEFVEEKGPEGFRQRTFERGSGETLSCGSGACAAFVAARQDGQQSLSIALRGGRLQLSLENGRIQMQGPASVVFDGSIEAFE